MPVEVRSRLASTPIYNRRRTGGQGHVDGAKLATMNTEGPDPYPELDLTELIGLAPDVAVAAAEAKGVKRIRINEVVGGVIAGPIDMALIPDRLDLAYQDGCVVHARFPTARSAGVWPRRPEPQESPQGS